MEILMTSQQSCSTWHGTQLKTQLLVLPQIACTCTTHEGGPGRNSRVACLNFFRVAVGGKALFPSAPTSNTKALKFQGPEAAFAESVDKATCQTMLSSDHMLSSSIF